MLLFHLSCGSDEEWRCFIFWIPRWFKGKRWHQKSICSFSEVCRTLSVLFLLGAHMASYSLVMSVHERTPVLTAKIQLLCSINLGKLREP